MEIEMRKAEIREQGTENGEQETRNGAQGADQSWFGGKAIRY